jgi:hypothetical protein
VSRRAREVNVAKAKVTEYKVTEAKSVDAMAVGGRWAKEVAVDYNMGENVSVGEREANEKAAKDTVAAVMFMEEQANQTEPLSGVLLATKIPSDVCKVQSTAIWHPEDRAICRSSSFCAIFQPWDVNTQYHNLGALPASRQYLLSWHNRL